MLFEDSEVTLSNGSLNENDDRHYSDDSNASQNETWFDSDTNDSHSKFMSDDISDSHSESMSDDEQQLDQNLGVTLNVEGKSATSNSKPRAHRSINPSDLVATTATKQSCLKTNSYSCRSSARSYSNYCLLSEYMNKLRYLKTPKGTKHVSFDIDHDGAPHSEWQESKNRLEPSLLYDSNSYYHYNHDYVSSPVKRRRPFYGAMTEPHSKWDEYDQSEVDTEDSPRFNPCDHGQYDSTAATLKDYSSDPLSENYIPHILGEQGSELLDYWDSSCKHSRHDYHGWSPPNMDKSWNVTDDFHYPNWDEVSQLHDLEPSRQWGEGLYWRESRIVDNYGPQDQSAIQQPKYEPLWYDGKCYYDDQYDLYPESMGSYFPHTAGLDPSECQRMDYDQPFETAKKSQRNSQRKGRKRNHHGYQSRWTSESMTDALGEAQRRVQHNRTTPRFDIKVEDCETESPSATVQMSQSHVCSSCYTISKSDHCSSDNQYDYFMPDNLNSNNQDYYGDASLYTLSTDDWSVITQSTLAWEDQRSNQSNQYGQIVLNAMRKKEKTYQFSLDSASTEHILTLEDALLLRERSGSDLKLLGVSGIPTRADVEGKLLVSVLHEGTEYRVDLGTSYGVAGCPLNILSVSKLVKQRAVIHLEAGNCYIILDTANHPTKIPIIEVDGMFQITGSEVKEMQIGTENQPATSEMTTEQPNDKSSTISHTRQGSCYAVSADLDLWHRRVRHYNPESLVKIYKDKSVKGFKLKNPPTGESQRVKCSCESCRLAKIQRRPVGRSRAYASIANVIGHTVSVDVKSVGVDTYKGYKYVICFVDHYSHLCMEYYMRSKTETTAMLKRYINDMWRLGKVKIQNIQSDRGSEFFEQEGESRYNYGRKIHDFASYCKSNKINHIKIPVEEKEKLAEQWNKEHFRSANTMLLEARLSPIFWADAVGYSTFQFNRTPNRLNPDGKSPWEMLTKEVPRWDAWKVFGCDVYEHIPNNKFDKVPGVPRGRKQLFIGFKEGFRGHEVFDPVTRGTHVAGNCYFNEDFTSRHNSLFFYDKRRELLKKDKPQPTQLDDFEEQTYEERLARDVFLDKQKLTLLKKHQSDSTIPAPEVIELEATELEETAQDAMVRPVRVLRPGKAQKLSEEDNAFIRAMEVTDAPCVFRNPNPKSQGSDSSIRYDLYMHAKTLKSAQELGATSGDIRWDYARGWITFPNNEAKGNAHVCNASIVNQKYSTGLHHCERPCFNTVLETCYEPEIILKMIEDRQQMMRYAEHTSLKVLIAQPNVQIDFSLDPEPVEYWQAVNSSESQDWKLSMDEEIASMIRFGVFNRVSRKVCKGRQVLGCKWVYKRKIGKEGQVTRYRSRLVCQGFRQKAFDSFNPDETFSPVVHKDTLRLFLSASAAENMIIYQADVKAAFLQAPLKEKIYMKCPPGFETYDENGGELQVLELNSAVYGLKQSNACFWTAVHTHLIANGFESTLGDPCLFKKTYDNGKVIFVCCYVDDLTYSAPDLETATIFLNMMRDRFVIDDKEGQPIEWLLGMAINQDMEKGTVHMSMEVMITKLAHGILTTEELVKSKNVHSPMLVTPLLKQETREIPQSEFDYLSVVGSLLHIANCVRCDIAYAVGALARHSLTVGKTHMNAAKRVVMYLYNTVKLGITYFRDVEVVNTPTVFEHAVHPLNNGSNVLQTFVDSDYAANQTRRSTMGMVTMMNGGPISWSSVLGKTVATSTCEAEVNAAVSAVKDSIHIKQLLLDLNLMESDKPLQIAEDNSACIAQAESGLRHVRNAKHYEVKLRFLQQHAVDKTVEFVYCPTDDQLADMFTKPLDVSKFKMFRERIMKQPYDTTSMY
jgi:hypothetical protein